MRKSSKYQKTPSAINTRGVSSRLWSLKRYTLEACCETWRVTFRTRTRLRSLHVPHVSHKHPELFRSVGTSTSSTPSAFIAGGVQTLKCQCFDDRQVLLAFTAGRLESLFSLNSYTFAIGSIAGQMLVVQMISSIICGIYLALPILA